MNKYLLSFCICLTVVTACNNRDKKEIVISEPKPKPYSYWKINGQEFSSNNVEGGSGKAISIFLSHDSVRFDLRFFLPFFPGIGAWPIRGAATEGSQNPNVAILGFYVGDLAYLNVSNDNNTFLSCTTVDGKPRFSMPPTWFFNYYDPNDSVLIEATLNLP